MSDRKIMTQWLFVTLRRAAWAPVLVVLIYAIAVKATGLGAKMSWLDIPAHFVGGLAITYFFAIGAVEAQAVFGSIPSKIRPVLALGLTALAAIGWEFLEYASDVLLGTHINLGVQDTLSDLFFGLLGGSVALASPWCAKCVAASTR